MIYRDFIEAGFRVFGLYGKDSEGHCGCGRDTCDALYKHPIAANWQHTPEWSEEQLDTMEIMGQFETGYGVLCKGLLVIDVDERNGGAESYKKLIDDVPEIAAAGLIVRTGSGGQSKHLYFSLSPAVALLQQHPDYPGIDFKSSGFVVGPGSLHRTGNLYEVLVGAPSDISPAPEKLVEMLKKPDRHRADFNGTQIDVSEQEISDMLSYISPDCCHDEWIKIVMAIHSATGGAGIEIAADWSAKSDKFPGFAAFERRWHSLGKCANPVTIGTLIHLAQAAGWQSSYDDVTFTSSTDFDDGDDGEINTAGIDLARPPGFVGELAAWINSQCLYPRENLAVAASLAAVSNICGLRHCDELDGMHLNLITFCVAGSSTGKEAVQQAYLKIMKAAGMAPAIHGEMKSQQEIIRNLLRHQAACYLIDELGIQLKRAINAMQRGGASYLEGLIGLLMSAYSKSNGFMPVSGDVREEVQKILLQEYSQCRKAVEENDDKNGRNTKRLAQIQHALTNIDQGIERPFLSVLGFTTPVTFNSIFDFEQATNGFLGRALIFNELETNPKRKKGFKKPPLPDSMAMMLSQLATPGEASCAQTRIEYYGPMLKIVTTDAAQALLDKVYAKFWELSEKHKDQSGLESIPRRGYELCAKISAILAAAGGVREEEHVRYACALAERDIQQKLLLAYSNVQNEDNNALDAVCARVISCLTKDHGEKRGALISRCRPHKKEVVAAAIDRLLEKNIIIMKEETHSGNGKTFEVFYLR